MTMAKLCSPRYTQFLQIINKPFNIKYYPYRNIQHGRTIMPISRLLTKTKENFVKNDIISATLLNGNIGMNSLIKCHFTSSAKLFLNKRSNEIKNEKLETTSTPPKKLGIVARFKDLTRKYWYVLVPVHVITSIGWLTGFYYLSTSGVDMVALLQAMSVNETIIDKLKDSSMGHYAITYMCYKIATPVRYTVTIGGTTISIKYLSQWGYIKPMPTKDEFQKMYDDKKAQMKQTYDDKKAQVIQGFDDKKAQMKQEFDDKKAQMKQEFDDKKSKMMESYESLQSKTKLKK